MMRWLLAFCLLSPAVLAEPCAERRPETRLWHAPDHVKLQSGGYLGLATIGIGLAAFHDHFNATGYYGWDMDYMNPPFADKRVRLAMAHSLDYETILKQIYFGYGEVTDPVRIGVIGVGDEGGVLIGALNPNYVQVAAICDIRPSSIHRAFHGDWASPSSLAARKGLMAVYGWSTEDEARQGAEACLLPSSPLPFDRGVCGESPSGRRRRR